MEDSGALNKMLDHPEDSLYKYVKIRNYIKISEIGRIFYKLDKKEDFRLIVLNQIPGSKDILDDLDSGRYAKNLPRRIIKRTTRDY
jgi:hypothetical protein